MIGRLAGSARAESVIFINIVGEAWANLRSRRMQAALSSFGIATGITAVVLLVSIVSGFHRYLAETLANAGNNVVQVNATQQRSAREPRGFPITMRADDVRAVLASSTRFDAGMAENSGGGIIRTAKRSRQSAFIRGLTAGGFEILSLRPSRGRLFLESEYRDGSRMAVLGAELASDLFAQESPIGKTIVVGEWPFVVVGVLDWVGDPEAGIGAGADTTVFVTFSACAATLRGNDLAEILRFRLRSRDESAVATTETRIAMKRRGEMRGETSGEYRVVDMIEQLGQIDKVLTGIKLVVGLVGGIGLFVGAVGVANVMLVSVRERRQEIGVRRALGATSRAVFIGFLLEGLAITLSGGLVGILAAWALTTIAIFIPQVPAEARPHISLVTALTAVVLLTLVGLIAGVGPAKRAAGVFPAEALRAE